MLAGIFECFILTQYTRRVYKFIKYYPFVSCFYRVYTRESKVKFSAKMKYDADTVNKLTEMQYAIFHYKEKFILFLASVFFLFCGFYMGANTFWGILFIFMGCILITGINTRPRSIAKKFIKQLDGKFPSFTYTFTDTGFASYQEDAETEYSSIIRLIEDKKYLYIYVTQEKAYMIDSSLLTPNNREELKSFISKKTGLKWSKPFSFFTLTVDKLLEIFGINQ